MNLYRLLLWFLRLVVTLFFRTVEVVGREHVPTEGPVVFVGNHPNSLIDPVLIITSCPRVVRFAARDGLFQTPVLRWVLRALGAVPVRRRQDHGGGESVDNSAAFEALFQVLAEGGAFGIFPEGISHAGSELAPLKTGAARIALGAASRRPELPVAVVPCGLNYHRRTRMRSQVLVQYGPPLRVDAAWVEAWQRDERAAGRALTEAIEASLRALTVNAPDFATLSRLDAARRLYTPPRAELSLADQAELTRRFLSRYRELSEVPEVAGFYRELGDYLAALDRVGLTDAQLALPLGPAAWAKRLLGYLGLIFVLLPLALPGLVVHLPVLVMAVFAGEALTRREDVRATTKMMVATLLIPVVYALVVAGLVAGSWALPSLLRAGLAAGVLLPLSGLAAIKVLERQAALRRALHTLLTLFAFPRELKRLRAERERLGLRVRELVERFVDPDLPRLLPPQA